jgi:adenylate kinase family enzyme
MIMPFFDTGSCSKMNQVIAICGPPGCGKSTLATHLAQKLPGCCRIDIDDYQSFTQQSLEALDQWVKDGADYNQFVIEKLGEDLEQLKKEQTIKASATGPATDSVSPILFETHFGRGHNDSGQHIDTLIWIDIPLDIALARNLKSFCQDFTSTNDASEHHQQLHWLSQYLEGYSASIRHTLTLQRQYIRPDADIFVDGTLPSEQLAEQLLRSINQKLAR